jgi:hypothetical protein
MQTLAILFGSSARVKIVRLFLFNKELVFDIDDIALRIAERSSVVKTVVAELLKIGLIRKRLFVKTVVKKVRGKKVEKRAQVSGWGLDDTFKYLSSLQSLLIQIGPLEEGELMKRIKKAGKLKFVATSGIFVQNWEARLDLILVGDGLRQSAIERAVHSMETEIGREIRYSAFETRDFAYRLSMHDKLIRDVLDFPHHVLVDKIGISA